MSPVASTPSPAADPVKNRRGRLARSPRLGAVIAFVRCRGLARATGVALLFALAATAFAGQRVAVPEFRYLVDFSVPVAEVVPLAHAVVLATTLFSPMADLEQTSAQPMSRHRGVYVVVLLSLALSLSALPLLTGATGEVFASAARNVVGSLGLAMISARLFGSGLAWLLPFGMFGPTLLLGVRSDNTPEPWAWSLQPSSHASAAAVAVALWVIGACAAATGRPRQTERAEQN
ncbi:hypothetical protein [Streptomyces curacoi]|uniref:Uncharacterized protein n=1 Tax=Streptomyces curacoi TaxID=146536 RepID=A0A117PIX7_9ACTN|nr:hypothetical protein [Streptomyces curacoi]KUM80466.1 hypothetical protein AQI70_05240 [Streptomyces curacoi]